MIKQTFLATASQPQASNYDSEWECVCERQQVEINLGHCIVVLDIEYCGSWLDPDRAYTIAIDHVLWYTRVTDSISEASAALEDMPKVISDIAYYGLDEEAYYSESNEYNTDILITNYRVKDSLSFIADIFRPAV